MTAYYNEFDPFAAAWLRELIKAGHIAPGDVDDRSIADVRPSDLAGYTQCHFFAGIGVWSHALRRAGWSDSRPIWTGSCPCQPFSAAGKGGGFDDERHLWPHFHHLIRLCRPAVVAGEQVASKDGLGWLDLVQADMEGTGYAFGAVDTCSAGFGAPHIRQRLWWLAERLAGAECVGRERGWTGEPSGRQPFEPAFGSRHVGLLEHPASDGRIERRAEPGGRGFAGGCGTGRVDDDARLEGLGRGHQAESGRDGSFRPVAEAGEPGGLEHPDSAGWEPGRRDDQAARYGASTAAARGVGGLADADGRNAGAERQQRGGEQRLEPQDRRSGFEPAAGPTNGHWRDADWLFCRDGNWRPVEPGTFPLAHGAPARVGRLRGYGNAINAEAATAFVEAYLDRDTLDLRLSPVSKLATPELDIFA